MPEYENTIAVCEAYFDAFDGNFMINVQGANLFDIDFKTDKGR